MEFLVRGQMKGSFFPEKNTKMSVLYLFGKLRKKLFDRFSRESEVTFCGRIFLKSEEINPRTDLKCAGHGRRE